MTLAEKIWGSSIGAFIAYGKTAAAAALKPLLVTDNGDGTGTLVVSSALPTGAATSANQQPPATTVTEDYITISVVDTEYSKALPTNCKAFSFRCVDSTKLNAGSDIRYAFTTGKVATPTLPFQMLDGGAVYSQNNLSLSSKTLYVAGITAGDIVLLEMWS